ncbi:DUF4837 family protein [Lentiprolixibacter aurantiacus]|uniref:DUF4837 family protein n=1 Tax=Lentiprolixibacter aurantiacus TaxID=2993939 RepID=A0AAE3MJ44_9FLAO|nr:DUF4837 family protein [Lentiprolixibacter aurantiacus]MCX2718526.1 DUF4837 family protein [Lentiprolixibacter aurantiacus]
MKKVIIALFALTALLGCEEKSKKRYKPGSVGAINSLAVVMETPLWEGKVGDKVREYFAAPMVGLTWEEPLFTIEHMPQQVFTGMTRHRRSVLFVSLDSLDLAHIKTDLYASPQKVGVIKGETEEQLLANLEQGADKIIAAFKENELEEAQKRFKRSLSKDKVLENKFGIKLNVPSIYVMGKEEDNFVWIDRQIQKGTMNIIAYTMPSGSFENDSTFVRDIVRMRDSIGQKYIPGPDIPNKTTYMITEKAFAPYVFSAEIAGKKAAEVRGIWEVKNYPMAGPFLTYIINDDENDRILVLEGFTFAPATNKRDYMFELEAIMKTLSFVKPE